jgi:selenocysteine-specific elongation factor
MKIVRKKKNLPPVMIGTAGHVDHGKTSLVKILTGCDTDKLKEEKERGLSINLGFAPCALSGERMVGIVDVPGHIDFIRNMVSGASSIDILILVVAADDGIMPQTVEHLQIIKMLSSPKLMVALTKIDLVDDEMVELAKDEISDFLEEMGFPDVPVMPVSNIKLDGVSAVKNKIEEMVGEIDEIHDDRRFRMNIQKHFSVKGMGTVATGIPVSGELNLDDPLVLLPDYKNTSVRALQNYKLDTDHTASKICCAVNIRDINEEELERGKTLISPDAYTPEESAIVTLLNISKKYTIKHNNSLRFHSGTFESKVKISIIGSNSIKPMC